MTGSLNHALTPQEVEILSFKWGHIRTGVRMGCHSFLSMNWMVVMNSVIDFVTQAFHQKKFPEVLNNTLITLLPKVPHVVSISQFRPIALTNVLTKIIYRIIANPSRRSPSTLSFPVVYGNIGLID